MAISFGIGDFISKLTGGMFRSTAASVPDTPTIAVVSDGNGTSATVTISNSDAAATNYVYYRSTATGAWTQGESRTGDGAVAQAGLSAGRYSFLVVSESGDYRSLPSNVITLRLVAVSTGITSFDHFFVDWETDGYFPVTLHTDHEPLSILAFSATGTADSPVMLGCRDGYIRRYTTDNANDDGVEFTSSVVIGPMRLGGSDWVNGTIYEIVATLADDSGDVEWAVMVADTMEGALDASASVTGTWVAGRNHTVRPRRGGGAFALRLENGETNNGWALEVLTAVIGPRGRQRKA